MTDDLAPPPDRPFIPDLGPCMNPECNRRATTALLVFGHIAGHACDTCCRAIRPT